MCQSYIESALSDYYDKVARISGLRWAAEMNFHQHLAGPRNVTVELKYYVLCL